MSRLLTLILACRFGVKFSGEFNYTLSSCCLFFIPQRSTRPSVTVFAGSLFLVRSQATVDDSSWMSAMIPHHSIAILTSERAKIKDKRVQELATNIIEAQRREIKEMQWLLKDIEKNGLAETQEQAQSSTVPDFNAK